MNFYVANQELSLTPFDEMQDTFEVRSKLRSYSVRWDHGSGACDALNHTLRAHSKTRLLIDKQVYALYRDQIDFDESYILTLTASEASKSLSGVTDIYDFLQRHEMTKQDVLVVVGGGIIQDIAGFACATYKRGMRWIHFPTTLLSMADSCIGGKANVNFNTAKNQLGLFYPAFEVVLQPLFLKTLTSGDVCSGLGEVLKCALIGGESLLECYRHNVINPYMDMPQNMYTLIANALSVKKAIVEADEFELSLRFVLNYGHTLGHAIESLSDYRIAHGHAVVIGMMLVNRMHEPALSDKVDVLCKQLLHADIWHTLKQLDVAHLYHFLKEDKKLMGNQLRFVMLNAIGHTSLVTYPLDQSLFQLIESAWHDFFIRPVI